MISGIVIIRWKMFNKFLANPNPTQKASNEYDKYFGQPIKLLERQAVIHGEKSGRGYTYSIVNKNC